MKRIKLHRSRFLYVRMRGEKMPEASADSEIIERSFDEPRVLIF